MLLCELLATGRREPVVLTDEMRKALTVENIVALLTVCRASLFAMDTSESTDSQAVVCGRAWVAVDRAHHYLRELLP